MGVGARLRRLFFSDKWSDCLSDHKFRFMQFNWKTFKHKLMFIVKSILLYFTWPLQVRRFLTYPGE